MTQEIPPFYFIYIIKALIRLVKIVATLALSAFADGANVLLPTPFIKP